MNQKTINKRAELIYTIMNDFIEPTDGMVFVMDNEDYYSVIMIINKYSVEVKITLQLIEKTTLKQFKDIIEAQAQNMISSLLKHIYDCKYKGEVND